MLLQPFAENAIWHGLMNKEGEGHLWININQKDSTVICTITDDGIGRKKAAELQDRTVQGQINGHEDHRKQDSYNAKNKWC
jgi:sensor histidine kinase YesM